MERKEFLSSALLCRFCLSQSDHTLMNLYDTTKASKSSIPLDMKILSSVNIEVFPSDKMPRYICNRCNFFMNLCHEYKQVCRNADRTMLSYIQTGTALEPIAWPQSLTKVFRYGAKPKPAIEVVKTVVEGGATVEVCSQDVSDSEDDEENVYSVKIGDGPDDSASIKIVTSKDLDEKPKIKQACPDELEAVELPPAGLSGGCWACDVCSNTYPLQQMLELHIMQKHRSRTFSCDQCDAKFYNKYDLTTHQTRHSDEMPFECVACDKKFKRHVLLKRHEKVTHADMMQHKCMHCPATFISLAQYDEHQLRHFKGERAMPCTVCNKKFPDKPALQRHIEAMHTTSTQQLSCKYCPAQFPTVTKLARHVRTHAPARLFPCKYCEKSFTKAHHQTRHVKLKHSDQVSSSPGDEYRCEQCAATFGTQDELIYHSAIHATQNLTCPLCQERFEDVDAVTSHIKSHVSGMEFMCEFCELVFTSKEKLDCHMLSAHDDEIRNANELTNDESSMEMDEYDDEDAGFQIKEEGDHMVVEINKPDEFMLKNTQPELEDKLNNTASEESEPESMVPELPPTPVAVARSPMKSLEKPIASPVATPAPTPVVKTPITITSITQIKTDKNNTATILRKAEEIKRKVIKQVPDISVEKKEKPKAETISTVGASDKSLRLLEKELQDLQRTNSRNDQPKTPKTVESARSNRRPQIHTSTPKVKSTEEKKSQPPPKPSPVDRKVAERRGVKENKEPKEVKEPKSNNGKEEKSNTGKEEKSNSIKEVKETKVVSAREETKEKSVVKNGASNKSASEEGVRRSSRPSKVKDYAKMIRERTEPSDDDDSSDDDDEEYVDQSGDKSLDQSRGKLRRGVTKPPPKPVAAPAAAPAKTPPVRKRGRPRKAPPPDEIPAKIKKDDKEENEDTEETTEKMEIEETKPEEKSEEKSPEQEKEDDDSSISQPTTQVSTEQNKPNVIVAPSGQTLKKVPIKALPPGVKPLPFPTAARPMGPGELCEMQIGKKMVKVQKIVMTKAEVEAMAKKGLVEMKDGTMVLKQGIKLPSSDPTSFKSTLVSNDATKESPTKQDKPAPSRCELGDS